LPGGELGNIQMPRVEFGAMATDWTFGGLWPFQARWFDTPDGRMHYIDEGPRDARPVVLVHGNPTWGFLYRNFVAALVSVGHRAIVPDHLGFGRSEKPPRPELYRISAHASRLEALLESLDLRDATVVPQDWGGPIGLSWAVAHPERVSGLFILNTIAHRPPGDVPLPLPLRLFRTPGVGEVMVKGLGLFHRVFLFRAGVVHRERLTPEVKRAYLAPHPSWSSRTGVLVFPREIPSGPQGPVSDLLAGVQQGLERDFRQKPVKIVWAMKDVAFTPQMLDQLWLRTFPDAPVTRLDDAGHYLQEDAHERIVPELLTFLAPAPGARAA
jgi:haloalkane dehalogenase